MSVPNLLAVETSTEYCSVAVLTATQVYLRHEQAGQSHSTRVLPMVAEVLHEAGLSLADCSAIAFGAGPGSFTGLRIACSVVQGLAFGAGIPVIPVGTLMALAEEARLGLSAEIQSQNGIRFLVVQDARMAEVYWTLLEWSDHEWLECVPPSLSTPAALRALLDATPQSNYGCGNGWQVFATELQGMATAVLAPQCASAQYIAQLGAHLWKNGKAVPAELAAPFYVRDRIALTTAEREQAKATRPEAVEMP